MTAVTLQPADAGAAPAATEVAAPVAARLPSLRRNFLLTLAGNVTYGACQWGILVVLAKLTNPDMVGQFVLGIAIAAPVFFLANLQLSNVQATDAKRETPFEDYLRLRLMTTLGAAAALALIVAACGYSARTAAVILLIGGAKTCDSVIDIFHGLYQQHERMRNVSASLICNGMASLAATALAVWWKRDALWGAAAFAFGSLAALALYNLPVGSALWRAERRSSDNHSLWRPVFTGPWNWRALLRLAWLATPLGVAAALVAFNGNLPRYFIHHELGDRALGVFAAMAYAMTAGITFVGALCNAAVPRMAQRFANNDFAGFNALVVRILVVAGAAGVAGLLVTIVAGRQILTVLYSAEYAKESAVFAWLMLAAVVAYLSSALGYAVTATRAFSMLTLPYAMVTGVTVVACLWLIPTHGLTGAAWTVGISAVAGCVAAVSILARLRWKHRRSAEATR
jgi:O-antigen/teichoic acid export membrane protein